MKNIRPYLATVAVTAVVTSLLFIFLFSQPPTKPHVKEAPTSWELEMEKPNEYRYAVLSHSIEHNLLSVRFNRTSRYSSERPYWLIASGTCSNDPTYGREDKAIRVPERYVKGDPYGGDIAYGQEFTFYLNCTCAAGSKYTVNATIRYTWEGSEGQARQNKWELSGICG